MLDIKWLSENDNIAKKNLGQRNFDVSLLDKVIVLNNQRKDIIKKVFGILKKNKLNTIYYILNTEY